MIIQDWKGELTAYDIMQARGRPYEDLDYITHSWLSAYKMSPEMDMPGRTDRDYYHYTHKKLNEILPRCSQKGSVYVCHTPDNPDEFRGYLVAEAFEDFPPIIHWCQVKKHHKKQGVATALIKQFFLDFNLKPDALVYTFSSWDMKRRKPLREAIKREGMRLLYLPDMKHTLNAAGWEV